MISYTELGEAVAKRKATLPTIKTWKGHTPHSMRVSTKEAEKNDPDYFKYIMHPDDKKFKHAPSYVANRHHSDVLAKVHPITNPNHKAAIETYTQNSGPMNRSLRNGHELSTHTKATVKHLDAAIKENPVTKARHVYHGAGFDPREHVDETGHLHTKEFISASHDRARAHTFASKNDIQSDKHYNEKGGSKRYRTRHHVMHIHLKPGDNALHVDHLSSYQGEHETIIGRNSKLKYHGTTHYFKKRGYGYGGEILHVHHFTMANSDKPKNTSPETHIKSLKDK